MIIIIVGFVGDNITEIVEYGIRKMHENNIVQCAILVHKL